MMGLFLDVFVIIVLVLFAALGYRKGFIKSVMGLVSLGLSLILAINFYAYPAEYINEHFVEPYFANNTAEDLQSLMNGGTETIPPEKVLADKPDTLTAILDKFGVDVEAITGFYENSIKSTTDSFDIDEIADKLSGFIVESTARTVSNILGFLLVFIAGLIVLNLLLKLLDLLFKLPVLKFTNKLFGMILGVAKGLVVVVVVINVVAALIMTVGDVEGSFWSKSSLETSVSYQTTAIAGLIIDIEH